MSCPLKRIAFICVVLISACRRTDESENVTQPDAGNEGVFVFKGQPISSATNAVATANHMLKERGLAWGKPVKVLWQEDLGRYLVLYMTPEKEIMEVGERGVLVMTNGNVIVMPQL